MAIGGILRLSFICLTIGYLLKTGFDIDEERETKQKGDHGEKERISPSQSHKSVTVLVTAGPSM